MLKPGGRVAIALSTIKAVRASVRASVSGGRVAIALSTIKVRIRVRVGVGVGGRGGVAIALSTIKAYPLTIMSTSVPACSYLPTTYDQRPPRGS